MRLGREEIQKPHTSSSEQEKGKAGAAPVANRDLLNSGTSQDQSHDVNLEQEERGELGTAREESWKAPEVLTQVQGSSKQQGNHIWKLGTRGVFQAKTKLF